MTTELEHHRLDRLLGRGAGSEVWLAWHPDRPMPVAIKRAVPGSGRAPDLRDEAAVLARARHPGVVTLLDVVDDPPGVALVLAHLGGGSLRDVLDERGTLSPGELVAVLEPVAAACTALARRGLVHGDLKPEHICFTEAGEPVLVDLGSASSIGEASRTTRSGTPAYLDPAVAAGGAPAPTSEVFALAVVAYEALTGRLPHRGDPAHVFAAAAAGSHRSLRSWPAVPAAVADAVERGLDPDQGHGRRARPPRGVVAGRGGRRRGGPPRAGAAVVGGRAARGGYGHVLDHAALRACSARPPGPLPSGASGPAGGGAGHERSARRGGRRRGHPCPRGGHATSTGSAPGSRSRLRVGPAASSAGRGAPGRSRR